jgi:hypothetical protein
METDEKRHGGKEAAALSGGHLCHVCGYQYPNPHPSAKLRRSHRKHCGKALPAAVEEVEEAVAGGRGWRGRAAGGRRRPQCGRGDGSRYVRGFSWRFLLRFIWIRWFTSPFGGSDGRACSFVPLQVVKEDDSERRLARPRPMEEPRRCADLREKLTVLWRTR